MCIIVTCIAKLKLFITFNGKKAFIISNPDTCRPTCLIKTAVIFFTNVLKTMTSLYIITLFVCLNYDSCITVIKDSQTMYLHIAREADRSSMSIQLDLLDAFRLITIIRINILHLQKPSVGIQTDVLGIISRNSHWFDSQTNVDLVHETQCKERI